MKILIKIKELILGQYILSTRLPKDKCLKKKVKFKIKKKQELKKSSVICHKKKIQRFLNIRMDIPLTLLDVKKIKI